MNNGQWLREHADRLGIPPRTLAQVRETLEIARKTGADKSMAKAMLSHGRMTDEAREFVAAWR